MQQYPIEFDVTGYGDGYGAPAAALILAKGPGGAVAILLSVAKNGFRIFVLAMLGTRVDPSYLTGKLHRQGGIIYFLIALSATFLLLWILHRGEEEKPKLGSGDGLRMIDRAQP